MPGRATKLGTAPRTHETHNDRLACVALSSLKVNRPCDANCAKDPGTVGNLQQCCANGKNSGSDCHGNISLVGAQGCDILSCRRPSKYVGPRRPACHAAVRGFGGWCLGAIGCLTRAVDNTTRSRTIVWLHAVDLHAEAPDTIRTHRPASVIHRSKSCRGSHRVPAC